MEMRRWERKSEYSNTRGAIVQSAELTRIQMYINIWYTFDSLCSCLRAVWYICNVLIQPKFKMWTICLSIYHSHSEVHNYHDIQLAFEFLFSADYRQCITCVGSQHMNAIFCSTEARSENNDNILEPCFQESNNTNKADRILARGVSLQNMLPNLYVCLDI